MHPKISFFDQRTIEWSDESNSISMIDQTLLPTELKFIECATVQELVRAIKSMQIRGAPAIGVAGAMGVALAAMRRKAKTKQELLRKIQPDTEQLKSARPTAANLPWGVDQALNFIRLKIPDDADVAEARTDLVTFVKELADRDVEANKKLASFGATLFRSGESVLTHCN